MKNALTVVFSFLVLTAIIGQNNISQQFWQKSSISISPANYFIQNKHQLGLSTGTTMEKIKEIQGVNGMKHLKYQELYKGLRVLGGDFYIHSLKGNVHSVNGYVWRGLDLNTTPAITAQTAIELAEQACNVTMLQKEGLKNEIEYSIEHTPELCVADRQYPKYSGEVALVWMVDISYQAGYPHKDRVLIDAHTGVWVTTIPLVMSENIEVEVATKYIGKRSIKIDSLGPSTYKLQDFTRGEGIMVIDGYIDDVYTSQDKVNWFIYDRDYESAQDVHYAMESYYDMLQSKFGYNSINNSGMKLVSNLHTLGERSFVNAYWSGVEATFGDGNCRGYGPLTTLDVVGHEFTHGLTQFNSGLVYQDDPGGLNEAMSDIFGKALEWYYDSAHFTWEIGEAFIQNDDLDPFRSMQDPNKYMNPKYYHGQFWHAEVHNSSGVLNYWFYLISDGEKGTNEKGVDYDVKGIGIDKAIQIAFAMNTRYLTSTSTYPDAVIASMAAVEELYGFSGEEIKAVKEAWKAVGLEAYSEKENDLAIEVLPPSSTNTFFGFYRACQSEMPSLHFRIYNLGTNTLTAGTSIRIDLTSASEPFVDVVLDKDLLQGDSVDVEKSGILNFEQMANRVLGVSATLPDDEYLLNNSSSISYYVLDNHEGVDISANGISLDFSECIEEEEVIRDIVFRPILTNDGCVPLERNRNVKATVRINGQTFEEDFPLPYELPSDWRATSRVEANGAIIKAGYNNYEVEIQTKDDAVADNNIYSSRFFVPLKVTNGYNENFGSFEPDEEKNIMNGIVNNYEIVTLDNTDYFGVAPSNSIQFAQIDPCPSVSRFFNSNFKSGNLQWCAKPSVMPDGSQPYFQFDMIQFRKANTNFPAEKDFQAILKLSIDGGGRSETKYFYGQKTGEIVHYAIPAPIGDNVKIRMDFFLANGTIIELQKGQYDALDAILISNVSLGMDVLKARTPHWETALSVTPNPGLDLVRFAMDGISLRGSEIIIRDAQAHIVLQEKMNEDSFKWNTTMLSPGLYFYTIIRSDGLRRTGKVAIIH